METFEATKRRRRWDVFVKSRSLSRVKVTREKDTTRNANGKINTMKELEEDQNTGSPKIGRGSFQLICRKWSGRGTFLVQGLLRICLLACGLSCFLLCFHSARTTQISFAKRRVIAQGAQGMETDCSCDGKRKSLRIP